MIKENKLVPYLTSPIPQGSWIIFSPHHDDETIGMGGSLILAREKGIQVTLVIVTDGSQGGTQERREKETQLVAEKLGIEEVIFLREVDRAICIDKNIIANVAKIIAHADAKSVFFPSPMELHPDHRMTTELVWNALKRLEKKPDAYAYEITVQNQVNHLVDISKVMEQKISLLKIYESQLQENDYLDFMIAMNRLRAYTLPKSVQYAEGFYSYGDNYTEDYQDQLDKELRPYLERTYRDTYVPLKIKAYDSKNADVTKTTVSVVIPCFNDGQYLQEALSSVMDQTYTNIEVIIVNDGSTDQMTIEILHALKSYGWKVLDLSINAGPSVARNRGIDIAQGRYILPLDADDKIAPTYIEKAVNILQEHAEIGIVYCEAEYFGLQTGRWELPPYSFPEILIANMIFASAMYRKADWQTVNGYNENMIHGNEDYDLWLSFLELDYQVYQIKETLFSYRIKKKSRTTKFLTNYKNILNTFVQGFHNHKKLYESNIEVFFDKIMKQEELIVEKNHQIQEQRLQLQGKERVIQELQQKVRDKERDIQNQDTYILNINEVAQSMRIKNRVKKVIKMSTLDSIWKIIKQLPITKSEKISVLVQAEPMTSSYTYNRPEMSKVVISEIQSFKKKPLISIIMPVYNVDPKWLELAVKSIENQWYEHWELCIVDDKSSNKETIKYLKKLDHPKIKVKFSEVNNNISVTSNKALKLANGAFVALMDNDDELTPDALYEVVKVINIHDAEFIYSDEDKLEMDGTFCDPHFKPDYAPDMFLSQNYINHLGVIKKELIDKVDGFTAGLEGAQDYDLYLKVLEHTDKVYHIQKVLYHWRKIPGSTAAEFGEKSYAQKAGIKALQDAMRRRGIAAEVHNGKYPGTYRVMYQIKDNPLVSIIIPFKDRPELLTMCIESILNKTTYKNFEIIGISNNSEEQSTFDEMKRLEALDTRIRFYEYNVPFNYSDINNHAVNNYTKGEQILLLNNDIEIITPEWIEVMLEFSQREDIGVIGAKLYYPNDTVQHAGVIIGIGGIAGHSHKHFLRNDAGYFSRLDLVQNLSAVTAACFMVKRSIFEKVNGLNENELKIAYNDVDFCLRVQEKGYLNVFTPYCEAYHHESISRGLEDTIEKQERFNTEIIYMRERHHAILKDGDPFYNPNLTLDAENFEVN